MLSAERNDAFKLQRFVDAQPGDYQVVLAESRAGRKRSHWIWYALPRIASTAGKWAPQR